MENQPFRLRKRDRHQEEYAFVPASIPWSKVIINIEQGTIFDRTPYRWLLLLIFYAFLYTLIGLLCFSCYIVFHQTLSGEGPKYRLPQPGLSFEPAIHTYSEDYTRIVYYEHLEEQIGRYVDRIDVALRKYGVIPPEHFGDCRPEQEYGYRNRKPCFFLRSNRILGFHSQTIKTSAELPRESPLELREYLRKLSRDDVENRIWVSCESQPFTVLQYYPQRYFNTSNVDVVSTILHHPSEERIHMSGRENARFYNESDFHRIIAVKMEGIQTNQAYHVTCLLWARNIKRDVVGKMGHGAVHFVLEVRGNIS